MDSDDDATASDLRASAKLLEQRRRRRIDAWTGAVVLVVLLAVASPVLFSLAVLGLDETVELWLASRSHLRTFVTLVADRANSEDFLAGLMCREFVAERLLAPATATFFGREIRERNADGIWLVRGLLEADNVYGVRVRSEYHCGMQRFEGNRWEGYAIGTTEPTQLRAHDRRLAGEDW